MTEPRNVVLKVRGLSVFYATPTGDVRATDDASFDLYEGETLGLVGESGSGKTTATSGILRMVSSPGRIVAGSVELDGVDLLALKEEDLRRQRWSKLALIPQGAMNSLNPTMKISAQIADVIRTHTGKTPPRDRILELFQMVGLPGRIHDMYPHELSGGMKQRVCIAMGIALNPRVIIADEATSALDVVVQRVVAQTMAKVRDALGVSMIMIGHDMGLMAQMVDRIAVMYSGKIVEIARVADMFARPAHPYSKILIDSVPSLTQRQALRITGGITHDPRNPPKGCIFQLRCPYAAPQCREPQPLREINPGQLAACCRAEEILAGTAQAREIADA
ncbi:ABC transporter ATP-binding protein [Rhodobacteraceae bacterium CCMM004]|nr:ABC transporter ATP-binding protein [Rhodobacteraceae bacterium CCMM004]